MSETDLFFLRRRGRPPRAGVRATRQIGIRITDDERRALEEVVLVERKSLTEIVRDAINEYVGDFQERVIFTPSGDKFPKSSVKQ